MNFGQKMNGLTYAAIFCASTAFSSGSALSQSQEDRQDLIYSLSELIAILQIDNSDKIEFDEIEIIEIFNENTLVEVVNLGAENLYQIPGAQIDIMLDDNEIAEIQALIAGINYTGSSSPIDIDGFDQIKIAWSSGRVVALRKRKDDGKHCRERFVNEDDRYEPGTAYSVVWCQESYYRRGDRYNQRYWRLQADIYFGESWEARVVDNKRCWQMKNRKKIFKKLCKNKIQVSP